MELTEEKVLELISTALGTFKTELLTEVDRKNQGLASNLNKDLKTIKEKLETKPEPKEGEEGIEEGSQGRLTTKALQTQIEQLKKDIADKEQAALESQKRSAIASTVAKHSLNQPQIVQKLFSDAYGGKLKNEGERWYLEDGESVTELDDLFKTYLNTDEGKYFIPPSGVNGTGAKEAKTSGINKNANNSLSDAFTKAFAPTEQTN